MPGCRRRSRWPARPTPTRRRTFGAPVGFLAGWSLLLDYLFLPMLNYLVIGIYMTAAIPAVPPWVWILIAIVVVTVLNIVGIVSVARANFLLLALQIIFIVVFVVMAFVTINKVGNVNLMAPFTGDGTVGGAGPIFAGAAILCLSFLGFDAVSTMSEEANDPRRTVPKAIMIATVGCGLIFFGLSYVSQLVFPSNQFADVDSGSLDVMTSAGGQFLNTFFTAAYIAGCIGSALTSQASVAQNPLRDGPRRHHAAQGVRPRVRPVLHADVRHPGGVGDLARGAVDRSRLPRLDREFRCAGCLLGGEPDRHQALLLR